jgi:DNA polymerase III delta prime subunit
MTEAWTEKYRPREIEDIILSDENRRFITNLIEKDVYPNMIFYGSPGTGKTTTILCLIDRYQKKHNCKNNFIHLNASHERGVDTIRNEIHDFSRSKMFFDDKVKFVLLDEVDSMTKQAQKQLYSLIKMNKNICYILICNYMNKLIEPIRNTLMILNFKNISRHSDVFINKCIVNENIQISESHLNTLKTYYMHDLRSIVNALQNYDNKELDILEQREVKELLKSKHPNKIIDELKKKQDFETIMIACFAYIINHYKVNKKLIYMMKYLLLVNQNRHFFTQEFLPYFKLKLN